MRTALIRPLRDADRVPVARLLDLDPYGAAPLAERVAAGTGWSSGATVYGYGHRRRLEAVCWAGGHLTPVGAGPEALAEFVAVLATRPRACSSIIGHADQVLPLWEGLAPRWGAARQVRADQPLLMTDAVPALPADPQVRPARWHERALVWPAAAAMYEEEVGVSPARDGGERGHRSRIDSLIRAGRMYVRIVDGQVVFKAEAAAVSPHTAQLQGVWVAPAWRGRGVATAAVAAVVADVLQRFAPTASLYVNGYNAVARRVYRRCGFQQVGTFATVLF